MLQHPLRCPSHSSSAVSRGPALARGREPLASQDLPHRLPRHGDPVRLSELLGQVVVVEPARLGPGELHNALARLPWQLPRRGPTAIAMDHPAYPLLSDPGLEPKTVALGDSKHQGLLCHRRLGNINGILGPAGTGGPTRGHARPDHRDPTRDHFAGRPPRRRGIAPAQWSAPYPEVSRPRG